ncbi:MAG: molybdopterin-dependent oxidoreductase [Myxococcota bacterium]
MPSHVAPSICRFCHANCGILVTVEDGRPVKVTGDPENPAYHGYTCAKGRQLPAVHAHPDRLLRSQKRTAQGFEAIASNLAMDEIAERLQAIVAEHGPRAVALYVGTYAGPHPATIPLSIGWLLAMGSRMVFTASTIDQPGKSVANALHGRWLAGSHVFDESDVWMLVGNNPLISNSGGIPPANPGRRLREAKARGMRLVVIDPRRTEVARFADVALQPRPGEDPTLLAAMLRLVLSEGLYDKEFVADHVAGVDALEAAVAPFTLEHAAARAGVEARDLERATRVFAEAARGCAVAGTGPNMAPHGNLTEYLLLCLNTLCGRWRRAGEAVPNPGALLPPGRPRAEAEAPRKGWGFGERLRVRDLTSCAAGLPTAALAEEILTPGEGQIRALVCVGSNPIAAWPDQRRTREAMESLDLLVSVDMKMSATAKLADYVIAPKLSLEVPGLSVSMEALEQTYVAHGYSEPYAQYAPPLVEPPAGADVLEEWEFFFELSKRMELPLTLYPVRAETGMQRASRRRIEVDLEKRPSTDDVLAWLMEGSRVPLETVKAHPHGAVFDDEPVVAAPADPETAARLEIGNAALLSELAGFEADAAPGGGFQLISRRMPNVYNSSGRDVEALHRGRRYNPAYLHPDDLDALGIAPGDMIRIASERDAILGVAAAAPELRRGVLSMSHCFGDADAQEDPRALGSNTGRLVDTTQHFDPHTGIPRMSAIPVAVEKWEGEAPEPAR